MRHQLIIPPTCNLNTSDTFCSWTVPDDQAPPRPEEGHIPSAHSGDGMGRSKWMPGGWVKRHPQSSCLYFLKLGRQVELQKNDPR